MVEYENFLIIFFDSHFRYFIQYLDPTIVTDCTLYAYKL